MAHKEPEVVRITTAPRSRRDDIAGRQRRYVISMTIRTVCFILAVVCIGHWFMWVFITASFVLPYVAVILANAGAPTDPERLEEVGPDPHRRAIGAGPDT
jgi:hypothetical protein